MAAQKLPGRTDFDMNAIGLVKHIDVPIAEINSGKVLIAGRPGNRYRVHSVRLQQTGAAIAALTDVRIGSTETTPTVIAQFAQAQLTDGAVLTDGKETGVTVGAGFGAILVDGTGIQIYKTGATGTGTGAISKVIIGYTIASA